MHELPAAFIHAILRVIYAGNTTGVRVNNECESWHNEFRQLVGQLHAIFMDRYRVYANGSSHSVIRAAPVRMRPAACQMHQL
jgi:hypothetical protein